MNAGEVERRLRRLTPPAASGELRDRVLPLARTAGASSPAPSRAERLWYSRRWRIAWAGCLAGALLLEWMGIRVGHGAIESRRPSTPVAMRWAETAALELGLPPRGWIGNDASPGQPDDEDRSSLLGEVSVP